MAKNRNTKRWWQWLIWLLLLPFLIAGELREVRLNKNKDKILREVRRRRWQSRLKRLGACLLWLLLLPFLVAGWINAWVYRRGR